MYAPLLCHFLLEGNRCLFSNANFWLDSDSFVWLNKRISVHLISADKLLVWILYWTTLLEMEIEADKIHDSLLSESSPLRWSRFLLNCRLNSLVVDLSTSRNKVDITHCSMFGKLIMFFLLNQVRPGIAGSHRNGRDLVKCTLPNQHMLMLESVSTGEREILVR